MSGKRSSSGKCGSAMDKSKKSVMRAYRAHLAKHPEKRDQVITDCLPGQLIDLTGLSEAEAVAVMTSVQDPEGQ